MLSIEQVAAVLTIRDERPRKAIPPVFRASRGVRSIEWLGRIKHEYRFCYLLHTANNESR